jgi:hypothetical protein
MHSPYRNKALSWGRPNASFNRVVPAGEAEPHAERPLQQVERPTLRLKLN